MLSCSGLLHSNAMWYLLCFTIIVLKCREVVVMGMNDNWIVLEVAAFAISSHFGCDAY
jgi:hypothetical protein